MKASRGGPAASRRRIGRRPEATEHRGTLSAVYNATFERTYEQTDSAVMSQSEALGVVAALRGHGMDMPGYRPDMLEEVRLLGLRPRPLTNDERGHLEENLAASGRELLPSEVKLLERVRAVTEAWADHVRAKPPRAAPKSVPKGVQRDILDEIATMRAGLNRLTRAIEQLPCGQREVLWDVATRLRDEQSPNYRHPKFPTGELGQAWEEIIVESGLALEGLRAPVTPLDLRWHLRRIEELVAPRKQGRPKTPLDAAYSHAAFVIQANFDLSRDKAIALLSILTGKTVEALSRAITRFGGVAASHKIPDVFEKRRGQKAR